MKTLKQIEIKRGGEKEVIALPQVPQGKVFVVSQWGSIRLYNLQPFSLRLDLLKNEAPDCAPTDIWAIALPNVYCQSNGNRHCVILQRTEFSLGWYPVFVGSVNDGDYTYTITAKSPVNYPAWDTVLNCTVTKTLSLEARLQTLESRLETLKGALEYCHPEFASLDDYAIELLSTWDSQATVMNSDNLDHNRLRILPALDTSNVTSINSAFNFSKVEKIISLDLPAVESLKIGTNYSAIFPSTLQEIGRLALPNCKSGLERLFWNRGNLERIDEFVLPLNNTFNLKLTFEGCAKLEHLGELDLRQCTSLQSAFKDCSALTRLSIKTSPALNNLRFAFHSCGSLEVIEGDIDCTNVTNMVQPIALCENLKRVNFINLGSVRTYEEKEAAIGLHRAPQWGADGEENYASLVNSLLVNSFDRTAAGYDPVVLYLSTAVVERLGEENVAAIRAKGFNVIALDAEHEDWFYD